MLSAHPERVGRVDEAEILEEKIINKTIHEKVKILVIKNPQMGSINDLLEALVSHIADI